MNAECMATECEDRCESSSRKVRLGLLNFMPKPDVFLLEGEAYVRLSESYHVRVFIKLNLRTNHYKVVAHGTAIESDIDAMVMKMSLDDIFIYGQSKNNQEEVYKASEQLGTPDVECRVRDIERLMERTLDEIDESVKKIRDQFPKMMLAFSLAIFLLLLSLLFLGELVYG